MNTYNRKHWVCRDARGRSAGSGLASLACYKGGALRLLAHVRAYMYICTYVCLCSQVSERLLDTQLARRLEALASTITPLPNLRHESTAAATSVAAAAASSTAGEMVGQWCCNGVFVLTRLSRLRASVGKV